MTRHHFLRAGFAIICLLAMTGTTLLMAATPAGTKIDATGKADYRSSSGVQMPTATSNTVTITVGQGPSVIITPPSHTKHVDTNFSASFGVSVTNTGPSADTFDLSAVCTSGSKVTIYRDDNGDGVRQSNETTVTSSTGALPSLATYKCIVYAQLPTSGSVMSDTATFTARSRADAAVTGQALLTFHRTSADPSYIVSWLVNGQYGNTDEATRLSTDYLGGESAVAPVEGTTSGGKTWLKMTTDSAYLDLGAPFGNPKSCAAYAFAYIYAPSAQTVNMRVGSDDGVKIWLNGQVVWMNDIYRSYWPDLDRTTVALNQGWNKLLVKISQGGLDWGFSVRLCDSSGKAIPGLVYALAPVSMDDTTAPVISNVKATPADTSALVEWDTDELASTLVDFGTTSLLGVDFSDLAMVNHHTAMLSGLTPDTTYYYKAGSADANGNTAWMGQYSFQTTAPSADTGSYVKTWLVNGYYPNITQATRLSMNYIGNESTVTPVEGMISGSRKWFRVDASTNYLDMAKAFDNRTYCAGYAFAYIYAPSAQTANMWLGSDDGIKVWMNGQVVWTNDVYRSYMPDADRTSVSLKQGWNKLLVKTSQGSMDWGFSVRLCDSSGKAIPGLVYALSPVSTDDATAPVISNVKVTAAGASAVVEWDTNELASTLVDYGATTSLGAEFTDLAMVAHHNVTLSSLTPGTTYYYKVGSADANGNTAWTGHYTFQTEVPSSGGGLYVQKWLVNGYYPNSVQRTRLTMNYIGNESTIYPAEGMISGSRKWFRVDAPTNYLDMSKAFKNRTYCAGYAAVYVYSPAKQTVRMWIGSDDGTKVWLNGNVVWFNDVYRSFVFDTDKTSVQLKAGWNRLVIRMSQGGRSWGLSVKFCDSAGNQIPGIAYSIAP